MITHAYVRYADNSRGAIVRVEDIKNFNPKDDFRSSFYLTKRADPSGRADYYPSRVFLVAASAEQLKDKIDGCRVRVKRLRESSGDSDDATTQEPKKKEAANNALGMASLSEGDIAAGLRGELAAAKEEVAQLRGTTHKLENELKELRALNRRLQWQLLQNEARNGEACAAELLHTSSFSGATGPMLDLAHRQLPENPGAPPETPNLSPIEATQSEKVTSQGDKVDIGRGLCIPTAAWKRIQGRKKDSRFVKDLVGAVWDPADLKRRSLQGNKCPRFPDRLPKKPLTPWKVAAIRECYKERLHKQGVQPDVIPGLLKQVNHFMVEKLGDMGRTPRRLKMDN
ncbi:uncharacterized protein LOC144158622 isoform X2 [Haemaphysalis longicornis]